MDDDVLFNHEQIGEDQEDKLVHLNVTPKTEDHILKRHSQLLAKKMKKEVINSPDYLEKSEEN